jgi:hypothetical protein
MTIDPRNAVDLSKVARAAALQRKSTEAAAMSEAEKVAIAWDKAMRRAFKGILPRPVGRAMLMRAAERQS